MSELDGEVKGCEVISKASNSFPYDAERYFDKDNFYPIDGDVIPMVAANAAQNTGNYFDQDNFYPADGVKVDQEGTWTDVEFSDAGGIFQNVKDYFSKEERSERKKLRKEKKAAKTDEIKSRAELNRALLQDKPSDVALAEALKTSSSTTQSVDNKPMSKTTKTVLIVGGIALVGGLIAFLVLRKKK
jgi:hypothetical protein